MVEPGGVRHLDVVERRILGQLASPWGRAIVDVLPRGPELVCLAQCFPERSRDPETIIAEATELFTHGYREVTLLGQNVNSYRWGDQETGLSFEGLLLCIILL